MKLKTKKILIIGLGAMGRAHLNSFIYSKNKYSIDLCDKKINSISDTYFVDFKKVNLNIVTKIPCKKKYDLAIIATNSKERFIVARNTIKNNKIKFLILEKFLFSSLKDYSSFDKSILKNKMKYIHVNSWGDHICQKLNLNIKGSFYGSFFINKGKLASNLIHILDLFANISKDNNFLIESKKLKIIESKRPGYKELDGEIVLKSPKGNLKIISSNKYNYNTLVINNLKKDHFIQINKNKKCHHYINNKKIKEINFPLASSCTEKLFSSILVNNMNKKKFDNYIKIKNLSIKILKFLERMSFKKINIT